MVQYQHGSYALRVSVYVIAGHASILAYTPRLSRNSSAQQQNHNIINLISRRRRIIFFHFNSVYASSGRTTSTWSINFCVENDNYDNFTDFILPNKEQRENKNLKWQPFSWNWYGVYATRTHVNDGKWHNYAGMRQCGATLWFSENKTKRPIEHKLIESFILLFFECSTKL